MGKRGKSRLLDKAAEIFDLPGEAAAGQPRVTVTGAVKAHIENHRGLLEYSREQVSVNAGRMVIRIKGQGLDIAAMSDMELVVTGTVASVEFLS